MKICYLADAESIHTVRWLQFFAGRGHEVHLLSKKPWETPIEGVRLHLLRRLSESPALAPLNLMLATAQVRRALTRVALFGHRLWMMQLQQNTSSRDSA